MKTRVMKKKFRRMLCASMAAIFVMSDMMPVAFAQGTAAETLPAPTDTERIIGFEMVNPLNSYEIKAGESLESLDAPEKIRVIVELPEDTKLSTFEEGEAPEQTDDTLPAYEYSHTLEQLSMSSEEDTASSGEEAAPSGEDTASSEDSSGAATSEDPSSAQEPSYTEEEIAGLYQESLTKKLGTVNVYALTDNAGASQYRVYGSIEAQAPQWYAIDENGVMLGAVEELDANWDFTGFDSTVAGEHQVKAQLPENYILSESVEMACLQIVVTQEEEEQSSIENEDGSLPDSLPVSYINALSATTASAATFPVIIEKEGSTATEKASFSGGEITSTSVPTVDNYLFIEETDAGGAVTSNGASLRVTTDGVVTSYNNVTAIYPVKQENGSTIWFYTTTLSDGKVAWQVPKSTELVLRYKPDPNALDQFSTVTITSDKWWDGSASGNYEDGQQNYRQVIPVGETISVKVDLPTLYSNYEIIAKSGVSDLKTSETTVSTNSSYGHTDIKSAKDTVTFTFAVGSDDINIKLKFKSYAEGRNFIAKLHQRYISNGKAYNDFPQWSGYKLIRMFERPGTVEFKHEAAGQGGNTSYKDSSGSWKSASKTAYQSYGPGTLDSSIKVPAWSEAGAQRGEGKEQPGLHEDTSVATRAGYFPQVNLLTLASDHSRQPHKNVAQDGNGEATLFYVFENTMKISNPNVNGSPPDQCLQPLPVGVKVYTQLHRNGIFVPLDTEFSLEARGKISNTISADKNVDLATVNAGGMTIKIRRIYHDITPYNINQANKTGNAHTWRYTVQVTGATGFLGMDFITFHDTQVQVGINEISNVKNLQVLHGKGGGDPSAPGAEMEWETLSSGQNWYRYTFGNNKGGAFGGFYNGAWQYHYADREGGVPIRVEQKEGYGIPYLEFTDMNEKDVDRVGVTDLATNADGYGKVQVTEINSNTGQKKPVQSRVHKITSGNTTKTVYEYLFGFKRSNNTWDEWGKYILFSVKADREQIAVKYDLNGGSISGNEPATSTTYVGDGFYVTVPKDYPTKGSNQHFIGWQIMDKSNQPLRDTNNKIIYLQPNQTIATTDTDYFPQEKLPLENGEAYTDSGGKGYYNTTVVNLKAAYSDNISEGQMVTGNIGYYVQTNVAVDISDTDLSQEYQSFQKETSTVPYQHGYYVVNNVGDTHPENGTTYIYNDPLSVYSGIAEYDNGGSTVTLASFRYDKGISVIYNALTDGAPDGVSNPSDDKLYTTVKDHENTITLKQPEGLTSTDRFKGWQAGDDTANLIPSSVTDLILDGTAKDNLTLSPDENPTKATIGGSLAEEIFTAGTVKLYAVYENSKIVSSLPDTVELGASTTRTTHTNGSPEANQTGSVPLSSTFYYTGSRSSAIQGLSYAVVKQELQRNTDGDVQTGQGDQGMVAKVVAYGDITFSDTNAGTSPSISVEGSYGTGKNGNGKIGLDGTGWEEDDAACSFTLKLLLKDNIKYQWDQDGIYTIHMWNDGNQFADSEKVPEWAGDTWYNEARQAAILNAFISPTNGTLSIPGASYTIKVLPKAVTRVGETVVDHGYTAYNSNGERKDELQNLRYEYPGDGSIKIYPETKFTVTSQFKVDADYPLKYLLTDENGNLDSTGPTWDTSTFKVMLMWRRSNDDSAMADDVGFPQITNDIQLWSNGYYASSTNHGGTVNAQAKASAPKITAEAGGIVTVEWTIKDLMNQAGKAVVNWGNFDGHTMEIIGFSAGNEKLANMEAGSVLKNWTGGPLNSVQLPTGDRYNHFPAERSYMDMSFQEAEYYVTIPNHIALSDEEGVSATDAGKKSSVSLTAGTSNSFITQDRNSMPVIDVKAQTGFSIEMTGGKSLTVDVLSQDGSPLSQDTTTAPGITLAELGTLDVSAETGNVTSLPFWLNADVSGRKYRVGYKGSMVYYLNLKKNDGTEDATDGFPSP